MAGRRVSQAIAKPGGGAHAKRDGPQPRQALAQAAGILRAARAEQGIQLGVRLAGEAGNIARNDQALSPVAASWMSANCASGVSTRELAIRGRVLKLIMLDCPIFVFVSPIRALSAGPQRETRA